MKALILCAGMGSRLRIPNYSEPKCLLKFNKRKLIDIQIDSLRKCNINKISIVTGYKSELVNNKKIDKFIYNKNWKDTNMVHSMFCASNWINNEDCLISYGDIFYSHNTIKNLINSEDDISLLYHSDFMQMWQGRYENPYEDLESFKITRDGYLLDIGQKVTKKDKIMGQFMGLIYIKKNGWAILKKLLKKNEIKKIDFTTALQYLVNEGVNIKCIETKEMWGEIDTIKDLNYYESYYAC